MYTITKEFSFEAAHHLEGLRPDHQCARPHGHSYRVEVELQRSDLTGVGFVYDYGNLDDFKKFIDTHLDHRDLNEVFQTDYFETNFKTKSLNYNTSAENLAHVLFLWCKRKWMWTSAVRVSETAKTWAEYRP